MSPSAPPRIAIVTAAVARDLDDDLAPLLEAFVPLDAAVEAVDWHDPSVDWRGYDMAVLRSTWDYTQRLDEFLGWLANTAEATHVVNPANVVRWNTDKHYLATLHAAGIAVVPSAFVEPGMAAREALQRFLGEYPDAAEFVVKPSIGAGSRDARRHARADLVVALAHMQGLLDSKRSVLLQPYLANVDVHGETALIFFEGTLSHAIRKGPLLRKGEDSTRALFATEHIRAREPDARERALAEQTLAAIPFAAPLLYARVDLIHDASGPRVLELELAEPSLFFATAAGSAARFAAAVLRRCAALRTAHSGR